MPIISQGGYFKMFTREWIFELFEGGILNCCKPLEKSHFFWLEPHTHGSQAGRRPPFILFNGHIALI